MTGLPANQSLQIEFVAGSGVFVDVSDDVKYVDGLPITRGRTSVFSAPSVGSMSFNLDNTDGRYTPLRQVLTNPDGTDSTTAHPYYPNVIPRRKVVYANDDAGTRAVGFVRSWPPSMDGGVRGVVQITGYDRLKLLDLVKMQCPLRQEASTAALGWPLSDPAFSVSALEQAGGPVLPIAGPGAAPTFGVTGVGNTNGTAVQFNPASQQNGQVLQATLPDTTFNAVEFWFQQPVTLPAWYTSAGLGNILGLDDVNGTIGLSIYMNPSGHIVCQDNGGAVVGTTARNDAAWHHVAITRSAAAAAWSLYVDGALEGSSFPAASSTTASTGDAALFTLGDATIVLAVVASRFNGAMAYPAIYSTPLTSGQILQRYKAGTGYAGDTTGTRISRYLGFAGLTSAEWNLDPGVELVGDYPQAGVSVAQACQDMAATEGGGAVFYIAPDGRARFADRNFRTRQTTPVMTLDAAVDLVSSPFAPDFDDDVLVNSATVARADATGTLSTQTVTGAASVDLYETTTDQITTYATEDAAALRLGQYHVATQETPGYRLPQVAVDLMTAETTGLYAALGQVEIGSRIRVINLPGVAAPSGQLDFFVEGWTETPAADSYVFQPDLSPADNPAFLTWGGDSSVTVIRGTTWAVADGTVGAGGGGGPVSAAVLGAQTGISRPSAGTHDGYTYINVESIDTTGSVSGDKWVFGAGWTWQGVMNSISAAGKVVTWPANCEVNWDGFNTSNIYGLLFGSGKAAGYGGGGYTTLFRQNAGTTSPTSKAKVPTVAGTTNPLFAIAISGIANFRVENCRMEYSVQGCLWNGFYVANSPGTKFFNVWVNGFGPGNASVNPGETFMADVWHSANVLFEQCTFDGRPLGAGVAVSATNVGINQLSPGFTAKNSITQNSGAGHGISIYEGSGTCTYQNFASINNGKAAMNWERHEPGFVMNINGCQTYGNGGEHLIVDSDLASGKFTIKDHVLSSGGTPSTGGPLIVRVDIPKYGTAAELQKMSDIHYYAGATLTDHFIYNDKNNGVGTYYA